MTQTIEENLKEVSIDEIFEKKLGEMGREIEARFITVKMRDAFDETLEAENIPQDELGEYLREKDLGSAISYSTTMADRAIRKASSNEMNKRDIKLGHKEMSEVLKIFKGDLQKLINDFKSFEKEKEKKVKAKEMIDKLMNASEKVIKAKKEDIEKRIPLYKKALAEDEEYMEKINEIEEKLS